MKLTVDRWPHAQRRATGFTLYARQTSCRMHVTERNDSPRYTRRMRVMRTGLRMFPGARFVGATVAWLIVALSLSGCSGLSALNPFSSPSSSSFTGTWTGSVNTTFTTAATLQLALTQSGSQLTGTWTLTSPNASQNDGGTVSGTVNGSSISASLQPTVPTACTDMVSATLNSSTQITGTIASNVCSNGFGSTALTLNKQ